jgi:hypothetical protein
MTSHLGRSTSSGARKACGRHHSESPERKNPLTFDSYAELRDLFRALVETDAGRRCVVLTGAGGNFCSGGDVHEIIGPLTERDAARVCSKFTRMTGDLVKAMRALSTADRGRGRRNLRRCRGDSRDVVRLPPGNAAGQNGLLFTRVGLAGATWAPARFCRGSSVRGARPSCSLPVGRCWRTRGWPGDSSTGWSLRRSVEGIARTRYRNRLRDRRSRMQ